MRKTKYLLPMPMNTIMKIKAILYKGITANRFVVGFSLV